MNDQPTNHRTIPLRLCGDFQGEVIKELTELMDPEFRHANSRAPALSIHPGGLEPCSWVQSNCPITGILRCSLPRSIEFFSLGSGISIRIKPFFPMSPGEEASSIQRLPLCLPCIVLLCRSKPASGRTPAASAEWQWLRDKRLPFLVLAFII